MRFLFVDLGSGWGGSERYLFWIMAELHKRAHWVGCVAPRPELEGACDRLWVESSRFKNLGRVRRLIAETAAAEHVDLVHFNADRAIQLAPFVRLPPGVPASATKHLTRPERKHALDLRTTIENRLTDFSLTRLACCICVSASTLAELRHAARERAVLIENGVPDYGSRATAVPRSNRVVFIGRVSPEKGIADLLALARRRVARRPERRTWHLAIAGTGPLADQVERAARELGREALSYLGFQTDTTSVYQDAAALVLPSSHEGMPLVVLEAFSFALPVVAYDIPGVRDVVIHGRNGFLVRPEEGADGLERALDRLFDDPAEWARLGAAARSDYEARHRVETMVEKTVSLLERTAAHSADPGACARSATN